MKRDHSIKHFEQHCALALCVCLSNFRKIKFGNEFLVTTLSL